LCLHKTSFVFGKSSNSAVLTSKVYSLLLGFDESCLLHLVSNGGWLRAASALQSMSSSKSCLHLLNTLNHRAKQRCTCFPRFLRVSELSILSALFATSQRCRKDVGDKQKHTLFNSQLISVPCKQHIEMFTLSYLQLTYLPMKVWKSFAIPNY
jgi:hypothetical protein